VGDIFGKFLAAEERKDSAMEEQIMEEITAGGEGRLEGEGRKL